MQNKKNKTQNKTNDTPDVIYADNDVNMPSGGIWSHQSIEGHDTPYIRTPEGVNPHDSEVVLTACVNEMTENLRPVTDMEEPWTLRKAAAVAATRITKLEVERGEIILTLEAQDLSLAAKAVRIAELMELLKSARAAMNGLDHNTDDIQLMNDIDAATGETQDAN